jgi:cytidylate kinase
MRLRHELCDLFSRPFFEESAMNTHDTALTLAETLLRSEFPGETGSHPPGSPPAVEKPPFTITISREFGALGTTTADAIGELLAWPVYDREIIDKIAEAMGKPATQVRGVDERPFNWLEEVLANLVRDFPVSPTAYMKSLVGTVRGLGAKGRCVIVGRGAGFILPPETTLRVRLIGEFEDRVRFIGRSAGISDREAARRVEQTDAERARFVRGNFGKDPADPRHYDLVLNTSRLSVEECADTVVHTLRLMMARPGAAAAVESLHEAAAGA